jgi:Rrf2 family cysteine metabolism transcriptional repressor
MRISQKCQYAVRAVLELAKRFGTGPATVNEIARKKAVPARFLEIILNELKQGGYVRSRRGAMGGYELGMDPREITVGQIIRTVDGPLDPVRCISEDGASECPLGRRCALVGLWRRAKDAVEEIYDGTTFQDLVEQELVLEEKAADFTI